MKYTIKKCKCILNNVNINEILLISNLINNKKIINLLLSNINENINLIDEDMITDLFNNNDEFKKLFFKYREDRPLHYIMNGNKIMSLTSRIRLLISEIEEYMYDLNFKSISFKECNNVFRIKIDNKYILTLTKIINLNKYSYIIHSVFEIESKKINHIKITLNFGELMIFLKDREETFYLNKEIIEMMSY